MSPQILFQFANFRPTRSTNFQYCGRATILNLRATRSGKLQDLCSRQGCLATTRNNGCNNLSIKLLKVSFRATRNNQGKSRESELSMPSRSNEKELKGRFGGNSSVIGLTNKLNLPRIAKAIFSRLKSAASRHSE